MYKLKPIDVVHILLDDKTTQDVRILLTMPNVQGAKPFITLHCKERYAVKLLTKRERIVL